MTWITCSYQMLLIHVNVSLIASLTSHTCKATKVTVLASVNDNVCCNGLLLHLPLSGQS